jgi:CRP-like cAMP-binding protein
LDHYVAAFIRGRERPNRDPIDIVFLPDWREAEWLKLLGHTRPRRFKASEVLIKHGETDRALHFVAEGRLEVGITYHDGLSMSSVAHITAGSVIGEQSFFDGQPRSANVWAVTAGEVLTLEFEEFERFAAAEPAMARDLTFALARILSLRLRNTTFRVRR